MPVLIDEQLTQLYIVIASKSEHRRENAQLAEAIAGLKVIAQNIVQSQTDPEKLDKAKGEFDKRIGAINEKLRGYILYAPAKDQKIIHQIHESISKVIGAYQNDIKLDAKTFNQLITMAPEQVKQKPRSFLSKLFGSAKSISAPEMDNSGPPSPRPPSPRK